MSRGRHAHPMHVRVSNRVDPPPHVGPLYDSLWLWSLRRQWTVAALCLPPLHRHLDLRGGSAAATVASHRDCHRLILLSNASPNSYLRMRPQWSYSPEALIRSQSWIILNSIRSRNSERNYGGSQIRDGSSSLSPLCPISTTDLNLTSLRDLAL